MNKLKTFKEIRKQVYSQCRDEEEKRLLEYLFILEDEEAIKWVHFFRKNKIENGATALMDFCNITGEELKEKKE